MARDKKQPQHAQKRSDRKAATAKAGKRSGPRQPVPEVSEAKLSRSIVGEQQFTSHTPLTIERSHLALVNGKLVSRMEAEPVPFAWDASRKQVIFTKPRRDA